MPATERPDHHDPDPRSVGSLHESPSPQTLFADPAVDRLASAYLRLAEEVWVLTERVAVLRASAARRGEGASFDAFQFSAEEGPAVSTARTAFVRRILEPLTQMREPAPIGESKLE
jgi:hypothetical protein